MGINETRRRGGLFAPDLALGLETWIIATALMVLRALYLCLLLGSLD